MDPPKEKEKEKESNENNYLVKQYDEIIILINTWKRRGKQSTISCSFNNIEERYTFLIGELQSLKNNLFQDLIIFYIEILKLNKEWDILKHLVLITLNNATKQLFEKPTRKKEIMKKCYKEIDSDLKDSYENPITQIFYLLYDDPSKLGILKRLETFKNTTILQETKELADQKIEKKIIQAKKEDEEDIDIDVYKLLLDPYITLKDERSDLQYIKTLIRKLDLESYNEICVKNQKKTKQKKAKQISNTYFRKKEEEAIKKQQEEEAIKQQLQEEGRIKQEEEGRIKQEEEGRIKQEEEEARIKQEEESYLTKINFIIKRINDNKNNNNTQILKQIINDCEEIIQNTMFFHLKSKYLQEVIGRMENEKREQTNQIQLLKTEKNDMNTKMETMENENNEKRNGKNEK